MLKKIVYISALVCLTSVEVFSQSATAVLNRVEDQFDQGNLSGIENALNENGGSFFKKGGFSKEEIIRAYRLLTLVHLYNDNESKAERAFINLLKADPEHPPTAVDPAEFHFLHEKFNYDPIFRLSLKFGVVRAEPAAFTSFGTRDNGSGTNKKYTPKIGIKAELNYEYQLPHNFEIIGGVSFSTESFEIVDDLVSLATEGTVGFTLTESQTWFKLPVMARYNIKLKGNLTPYFYGGYSLGYLSKAALAGSRTGGQPATISEDNVIVSRNNLAHAIIGGVGVKIASKTNFVVIETRYSRGLNNIVDSNNRYANQNLLFSAGYVDDNFSQNSLGVSIGYTHSFYKPKKLSNKKYKKKLQQELKKETNE